MSGVLEIDDLTVKFNGVTAIENLSLQFTGEHVTGVIGPNGAGKTTLLSVLSGQVKPTRGRVLLDGRDITGLAPHRMCHLGIAKTYQVPRPFGTLSVLENIVVAQEFGARKRMDLDDILDTTGLTHQASTLASSLSPSELRRLELARALATDPSVLLIDEVAAGMPSEEVPDLVNRMRQIAERGITLVLVEHVMDLVLQVSQRLVVMDRGSCVADGAPSDVIRLDHVIKAYFGTGAA